jgi:hypothetical protein
MAYFADTEYGNTSETFQAEMRERRRIGDIVKQIEGCRDSITTNLMTWFRGVQWAEKNGGQIPESAYAAMERLIEARRQENELFKQLFGIAEDRLAIGKR